MTSYSPFDKSISALEPEDLAILREVPESWYVEYKRTIDDPKTLAKALGALANTYGGWLIIGVDQSDNPKNTAQEFVGLTHEQLSLLLQRLGSSINAHIRPVPHYDHRILAGACETIGLGEERSIVVIHVPMSVRTPHIHSDGRVYQRVGDTSQPQPIRERRLLDELLQRADRVREDTRRWIEADPEFSKGEGEAPYLRLMLAPDQWVKKYRLASIPIAHFKEILNHPEPPLASIAFDSIHWTHDGIIARHVYSNNPRMLGLTFRIYADYSCEFIIPLNVVSGVTSQLLHVLSESYDCAASYVQLLVDKGYWREDEWLTLDVVDLNPLLKLLIALTHQYRAVLRLVTPDPRFHFKARILQAWRKVIFLDVPQVIESFARHGVPMLMHDEVTIPPGTDPDTFFPVSTSYGDDADVDDEIAQSIGPATTICWQVFAAFGVSGLMSTEGTITQEIVGRLLQTTRQGSQINEVE